MIFIIILQYKNVQSIPKFKICLAVEISEFFHFSAKSVGNVLDVVSKLVGPLVLFSSLDSFTVRCVVTNHSFPCRLQLFDRFTRIVLVVTSTIRFFVNILGNSVFWPMTALFISILISINNLSQLFLNFRINSVNKICL